MALTRCYKCGGKLSSQTLICPKCKTPQKRALLPTGVLSRFRIIGLVIFVLLGLAMPIPSENIAVVIIIRSILILLGLTIYFRFRAE